MTCRCRPATFPTRVGDAWRCDCSTPILYVAVPANEMRSGVGVGAVWFKPQAAWETDLLNLLSGKGTWSFALFRRVPPVVNE